MALRRASIFGGKKPEAATIVVNVESVELLEQAALQPMALVEVDMPGEEDATTKSAKTPVKLGVAKVGLTAKYEVSEAKNASLRTALLGALKRDTADDEDSEVLIHVIGVTKKGDNGKEVDLGTATYQLKRMLEKKAEVKAEILPVLDSKGNTVAKAKISITALGVLTALADEAKEAPSIAEEAEEEEEAEADEVMTLRTTRISLEQMPSAKCPPSVHIRAQIIGPSGVIASTVVDAKEATELNDAEARLSFDARCEAQKRSAPPRRHPRPAFDPTPCHLPNRRGPLCAQPRQPPASDRRSLPMLAVTARDKSSARKELLKARQKSTLTLRVDVDSVDKKGKRKACGVAELDLGRP
jgi:hypothetical protein